MFWKSACCLSVIWVRSGGFFAYITFDFRIFICCILFVIIGLNHHALNSCIILCTAYNLTLYMLRKVLVTYNFRQRIYLWICLGILHVHISVYFFVIVSLFLTWLLWIEALRIQSDFLHRKKIGRIDWTRAKRLLWRWRARGISAKVHHIHLIFCGQAKESVCWRDFFEVLYRETWRLKKFQ